LVKLLDVKMALFTIASRVTFVVGRGRKVLARFEGSDAISPSGAVAACSIKQPESVQFLLRDAGSPSGLKK
jgi:hypothetical protein